MPLKYKCIKRVKKGSPLDKIEAHKNASIKQKINTLLVPTAPMMFTEIMSDATIAETSYNAWKDGDKVSKTTFVNTMALLDDGYYKNGIYYETIANATNNAELFGLLGYESYKIVERSVKPEISIFNTDVLGELYFDVQAYKRVKCYKVEGTLITDGILGTPTGFDSLSKSTGTVGGFISGVLYQIRTQPSFTNGRLGAWTPYFVIRVR